MSEEKNRTEVQKSEARSPVKTKRDKLFFTKLVALIALIVFSYFGFKYFQILSEQKQKAKAEISKFDNIESEIFDLADASKSSDIDPASDISVEELKEKGAEFIYHMLLKNQVQINALKEQIQSLKSDFTKYKSQEKIGKIIFTYVDLRQKIIAGENYDNELKSFEVLSAFDEKLSGKLDKLKPLLKNYSDAKKLKKEFNELIPQLIATKNNPVEAGFIAKIRYNISKLIVIRRIDGKNPFDVDGIIVKTEKLLNEENYQDALTNLLALDQSNHAIIVNFLNDLNATLEVQKVDQEILLYLKNLSQ